MKVNNIRNERNFDDRIIRYAKQLWFDRDEVDGERIYTNKQIVYHLKENFAKERLPGIPIAELKESDIEWWSNNDKDPISELTWVDIDNKLHHEQVEKANQDLNIYLENTNIVDKIRDLPKYRHTMANLAYMNGWNYLFSTPIDNEKTAMWMIEFGAKEMDRINFNKKKPGEDKNDIFTMLMDEAQKNKSEQYDAIKKAALEKQRLDANRKDKEETKKKYKEIDKMMEENKDVIDNS